MTWKKNHQITLAVPLTPHVNNSTIARKHGCSYLSLYFARKHTCVNEKLVLNQYATKECDLSDATSIRRLTSERQNIGTTLQHYCAPTSFTFQLTFCLFSLGNSKETHVHSETRWWRKPWLFRKRARRLRHYSNGCLASSPKHWQLNENIDRNLSYLRKCGRGCVLGSYKNLRNLDDWVHTAMERC